MMQLQEHKINCPYCGESIGILVDDSIGQQNYIEDCQVCCRPINIFIDTDFDGAISLRVQHEDET